MEAVTPMGAESFHLISSVHSPTVTTWIWKYAPRRLRLSLILNAFVNLEMMSSRSKTQTVLRLGVSTAKSTPPTIANFFQEPLSAQRDRDQQQI
jgi:hypothetical protein